MLFKKPIHLLIITTFMSCFTYANPSLNEITPNNWMSGLESGLKINQIIMPGSHDAGMSELHHCSDGTGWIVGPASKTQNLSILGQANSGSRYFDIRVDFDHNELITYHRTDIAGVGDGCSGELLNDVLQNAEDFLDANPSETLILKFSHTRNNNFGHSAADTTKKVLALLEEPQNQKYLFKSKNSSTQLNLSKLPLQDVRGKIVAVFDGEYSRYNFMDVSKGFFNYYDTDAYLLPLTPGLTVYDNYSDTSDYDTMVTDQINKLEKYSGTDKNYLYLVDWALTGWMSIEKGANVANAGIDQLTKTIQSDHNKPNIIYIDFMNPELGKKIYELNYQNLGAN